MKSKSIKIGYSSRYSHKNTCTVPQIKMEGKWLEELGFTSGSTIMVEYEKGSICIRPLTEQELALKEYQKLKAELKNKEKELHLLQSTCNNLHRVAESSDTYCNISSTVSSN